MKSIANQYRDLKEGKMSQSNFMRNLRMSMPQYITNVTSFNDAVRILKNKAILTESEQGGPSIDQMSREEMIDFLGTTASIVKDLTDDELRDIVKDKNADLGEATRFQSPGGVDYPGRERQPEYDMGDFGDAVDDELEYYEREHPGLVAFVNNLANNSETTHMFDDVIDKYFDQGDPAGAADEFITLFKKQTTDDDGLDDMISRMEDEESGKYTKFQDFEGGLGESMTDPDSEEFSLAVEEYLADNPKWNLTPEQEKEALSYLEDNWYDLQGDFANNHDVDGGAHAAAKYIVKMIKSENINEAKKKKEAKAELHPNQIHPSELRMGIRVELEHTDDLDKAKKIALDHLAENPYYYTALKLSGIESPSAPKAKAPKDAPKKAKKKDATELVDKANQMVKVKDTKKKLKESNLNEAGGEYTFNGTLTNDEKKELDKILSYKGSYELEVDEVDDHYETTIIHDFYNEKNLEHAVKQVTGRLPQKKQFGDTIGFDNVLQSKLESLVREVMAEMYDGRDNLTTIDDTE